MKKFIMISGLVLSLFAGYGNEKDDNKSVADGVLVVKESRAILIGGLGFFGSLAGFALFCASCREKRQNQRLIAEHDALVDQYRRALHSNN